MPDRRRNRLSRHQGDFPSLDLDDLAFAGLGPDIADPLPARATNIEVPDMVRAAAPTTLSAADLEIIGIYLFGPRWQYALARAVNRSDRQVRRWAAGEVAVSLHASRLIEALVRDRHGQQMRRLRASYLAMIGSLSDTPMRARLLTMDLSELPRTPVQSEAPRTTSPAAAAA